MDDFYKRVVTDRVYWSELSLKYQKRFVRYRESMFTFLQHDSIPWNNNMAERAIRHLVVQEKISGYFSASLIHDYLFLLSIAQSCRFQGKSLLHFLMSGERDVNAFGARRQKRTPVAKAKS